MALAAPKDLPQLNLADALELTILVARKEPRRHLRVAARWLLRFNARAHTARRCYVPSSTSSGSHDPAS